MEFDVKALEELFERATITSDHSSLQGHSFYVNVNALSDSITINVMDSDTFDTVVTLELPAQVKTTFRLR